ncbi:protein matrimony [Drosophila grimshawi]|uniref:protein matrimony n=1 Tax=Drosophila grimshawi TaxID=7222 RepID=UPI000C870516|nr:protein matrimony [Drosophila grimshawi]
MAEFCSPKGRCPLAVRRSNKTKEPTFRNTLTVGNLNVRCSTPILGHVRSPNLSPINDVRTVISPASPMIFRKLNKQQDKKSAAMAKQSGKKSNGKDEDTNMSLDNFLDDSSTGTPETSLCRETRRRSLQATNHSFVLNHATNVKEVLILVGLETYLDKFDASHMDLIDLVSMKRDDLKRIGVRKDEDCNRILEALNDI